MAAQGEVVNGWQQTLTYDKRNDWIKKLINAFCSFMVPDDNQMACYQTQSQKCENEVFSTAKSYEDYCTILNGRMQLLLERMQITEQERRDYELQERQWELRKEKRKLKEARRKITEEQRNIREQRRRLKEGQPNRRRRQCPKEPIAVSYMANQADGGDIASGQNVSNVTTTTDNSDLSLFVPLPTSDEQEFGNDNGQLLVRCNLIALP